MNPVVPPTLPYFKSFVANRLRFSWQTGSLVIAGFSLVRFALALHANVTKSYQVIAFVFVAMALLPFLLLTRAGRQRIGVTWPTRWAGVLLSGLLGFASCTVLFFLAKLVFGLGAGNPLVYISHTYTKLPPALSHADRLAYFLIFSATSMVFSPIGEELFYRGFVHECFVPRVGERRAALVDSAAFALVHLAHFGLVYRAGGWHWLPGPALLWVTSLFGTCLLFSLARAQSGSVVGAMVAHALFNLTMNYYIFYHIL
ncbi:MAG: CPBP family intramembrane glutamic endopeptidase [Janthinobacterium lividum]